MTALNQYSSALFAGRITTDAGLKANPREYFSKDDTGRNITRYKIVVDTALSPTTLFTEEEAIRFIERQKSVEALVMIPLQAYEAAKKWLTSLLQ